MPAGSLSRQEYPGAEPWVPEDHSIPALDAAAPSCRGCELYRDATQVVMGRGDPHADLMLVGEQPGDSEDRQRQPGWNSSQCTFRIHGGRHGDLSSSSQPRVVRRRPRSCHRS